MPLPPIPRSGRGNGDDDRPFHFQWRGNAYALISDFVSLINAKPYGGTKIARTESLRNASTRNMAGYSRTEIARSPKELGYSPRAPGNNAKRGVSYVGVTYRQRHPSGISGGCTALCPARELGGNALTGPQRRLRRSRIAMRIVVDLNRCLGYAQCVPLATGSSAIAGRGGTGLRPESDDSQRQRVARAVASCPVQAIIAEMDPPSDRTTK